MWCIYCGEIHYIHFAQCGRSPWVLKVREGVGYSTVSSRRLLEEQTWLELDHPMSKAGLSGQAVDASMKWAEFHVLRSWNGWVPVLSISYIERVI